MPIFKTQTEITSLQEWERLAGPKRPDQWDDGRSAKEAARAWLQGGGIELPAEVSAALGAHPAFGAVRSWEAEPEAKLRFDKFAGEPRNSDLAVYAEDAHGPYLMAVEAKADEPFSETTGDTLVAALERYLENERSNGVVRVQQLSQALLGRRQPGDPKIKELRYQLLTACAGALCEAERRGYSRALLLIHEFRSDKTSDENHERNAADLGRFLQRLSHGEITTVGPGEICGPFTVPGVPLLSGPVQLFVGKVSRNLRRSGT